MPLYDYICEDHGEFEGFNSMQCSQDSKPCPACSRSSARIVRAPNVRLLSPEISKSMERNERSRESPMVHKNACKHNHTHSHAKILDPAGTKPRLQSYQGKRPWVIEHA